MIGEVPLVSQLNYFLGDDPRLAIGKRGAVHLEVPERDVIHLVLENLNTHSIGSLYEAFPPEAARRIAEKLEIHHTPKHGSWLNVAEIELRVLTVQCLNRRIGDAATLRREVTAWEKAKNESDAHVDWQFRSSDARIHLRQLYPRIQA